MVTHDSKFTREIKSRIAMGKTAFNTKKTLLSNLLDLHLRKKLLKCCVWSTAVWCWRRMEKISRADRVTNEAVLQRVEDGMSYK